MYEHIHAASEQPVLARAIKSDSTGKSAPRPLLNYYAETDVKIRTAVGIEDYEELLDTRIDIFVSFYGWPEMINTQIVCLPEKKYARGGNSVFEALVALGQLVP